MMIHDVEQGSDEWHQLRAGRPTASEFSKLTTSKGAPSTSMKDYAAQLAADHYAGAPVDRWEGNKWSDRGHENEDAARAWYELQFPAREVTQVGFITDDSGAGASPDALVDSDGLLEIKCPGAKELVAVMVYVLKHKKPPSKYIVQPQGQMLIAQRIWCDLLFFHPELPPFIIRLVPDTTIVQVLRSQIAACVAERNTIVATIKSYE